MNANNIDKNTYIEILRDHKLTDESVILIFKTIHSLARQEASATELSSIIGWQDRNSVIAKIAGFGKRISKKYNIDLRKREDGTNVYWELFFDGYFKGKYFIYRIKPELLEALNETGILKINSSLPLNESYLFVWNPKNWEWVDIEKVKNELKMNGRAVIEWSCSSHKSIRIGERAFIGIVGREPRGIFGSGQIHSEPFLSPHWEDKSKLIYRVNIELDMLLNPLTEKILEIDSLKSGSLKKQDWTPHSSGIKILKEASAELEELWYKFQYSEVIANKSVLKEGRVVEAIHTRYERNPYARQKCLEYYGYKCKVCNFDFEEVYGNIGYKFIHVHHIIPISNTRQETEVDPINDLIPICPNCHAMLHKTNPPISVEEMKEIIIENRISEKQSGG